MQVREHPKFGYRPEMQGYVIKSNLTAAEAQCLANSQYGHGGLKQLFISDAQKLIEQGILVPIESIKLR